MCLRPGRKQLVIRAEEETLGDGPAHVSVCSEKEASRRVARPSPSPPPPPWSIAARPRPLTRSGRAAGPRPSPPRGPAPPRRSPAATACCSQLPSPWRCIGRWRSARRWLPRLPAAGSEAIYLRGRHTITVLVNLMRGTGSMQPCGSFPPPPAAVPGVNRQFLLTVVWLICRMKVATTRTADGETGGSLCEGPGWMDTSGLDAATCKRKPQRRIVTRKYRMTGGLNGI